MSLVTSEERMMAKNILVFADGTGNEGGLLPDESRTNVYKLYRAARNGPDTRVDPRRQIAFYLHGIGTPTPGQSPRKARQRFEQMLGIGLSSRITNGYAAIASVWQPGDRIYLFGFSRGAYTVRCLAHVLELFGIPTKQPGASSISLDPPKLRSVCRRAVRILYRWGLTVPDSTERQKAVQAFREAYGSRVGGDVGATPYFVGVWDTVAAIGWGRFFKNRYDLHFPREVRFARHAMAIDEYRKDFARVKWGGSSLPPDRPGEPDVFQQIWFAGNHADIGGSYPETESRLSDVALQWMVDFITKELPEEARLDVDPSFIRLYPSADGMMHDECMVGIGGTPARWYPADRDVPRDAILHPSVYERLELPSVRNYSSYGKYRPAPLRYHHKAKEYFEQELEPTSGG
jgi:uncharacterized protein (DUF2235 family)